MPMHRVPAQHQPLGDLGVAEALCDQAKDLELARGEVGVGRSPRGAGRWRDLDRGPVDACEFEHRPRHGSGVPMPGEMIGALEGDEHRARDAGGELTTELERDRPVVLSVQDRRR